MLQQAFTLPPQLTDKLRISLNDETETMQEKRPAIKIKQEHFKPISRLLKRGRVNTGVQTNIDIVLAIAIKGKLWAC